MSERFNVAREAARSLDDTPARALEILPALAGEVMASGDEVMLVDLREALAQHVLHQRTNHHVASAVLAMIRTYTLHRSAHAIGSRP